MIEAATPWKASEVKALLDGIGSFGWTALQRRCGGRSKMAIYLKVRREFGGGGITRGSYSLGQAEQETGYHETQLRRAARALNQRWARTARGGDYLITAEQIEECIAWLVHDYWCKKLRLYCCLECGTDTKPHYSFGLCCPCFNVLRRYAKGLGLPFAATQFLALVQVTKQRYPRHSRLLDPMLARLELGRSLDREMLQQLAEIAI